MLLGLSTFAVIGAEIVLFAVVVLICAGGINPGWHIFLGLFAAAVAAVSAPMLAALYAKRGGRPTLAVAVAWLPSIAICVYFFDWLWPQK